VDGRLDPATPRQRLVITRLNMALGNTEHTEEYPMTIGDAGSLIRKMTMELRGRERVKRVAKDAGKASRRVERLSKWQER
jgi:hypothetical protein